MPLLPVEIWYPKTSWYLKQASHWSLAASSMQATCLNPHEAVPSNPQKGRQKERLCLARTGSLMGKECFLVFWRFVCCRDLLLSHFSSHITWDKIMMPSLTYYPCNRHKTQTLLQMVVPSVCGIFVFLFAFHLCCYGYASWEKTSQFHSTSYNHTMKQLMNWQPPCCFD